MANLTLERRLVRNLGSPRPEPGHHVVVYKESGEGRVFHQVLPRGTAFAPPLLDRWFGHFVGYAVPAGPSLRHRFSEQLTTGVGERHDVFTLHVTLRFQVSEPGALVEHLNDDPLGSLESEIREVLRRRASHLRYAALIDDGFDAERYFLRADAEGPGAGAEESLERFQNLALTFGIELQRVEVTRTYSATSIDEGISISKADYAATRKVEEAKAGTRVEVARKVGAIEVEQLEGERRRLEAQTSRQIETLDAVAKGLNTVIENVAGDTDKLPGLSRLIGELGRAREELGRMLGPSRGTPPTSATALLGAAGDEGGIAAELRDMVEAVRRLGLGQGCRTRLLGRLLHILAEVCLGDESEEERLEGYVADLRRYGASIELPARIPSAQQRSYFQRFGDVETVRRAFDDLWVAEDEWAEVEP